MEETNTYSYKLYYDATLLRDSAEHDEFYETEEEAIEEAREEAKNRKEMWETDGAWHQDDTYDNFDIVVEEG